MKLTGRIILLIGITTTIILSAIFSLLTIRYNQQIEKALLNNARTLYRMVVTVRNWASDYGGVFVKKTPDAEINPFLPHPALITQDSDTLVLRNPALITRELSNLSKLYLGDAYFHMSSKKYINPQNKPDYFELEALNYFEKYGNSKKEFYGFEKKNDKLFFRYFAPLYTKKSCLSCHKKQGYHEGDLRGGISIHLSAESFRDAKRQNLQFMIIASLITILILCTILYFGLHKTIIHPIEKLTLAAQKIEAQDYDFQLQPPENVSYEIGKLFNAFNRMRDSILAYLSKLKFSEEKYRTLIENSFEAIAITAQDGKIAEINSRFADLLETSKRAVIGKNIRQILSSENIKSFDEQVNAPYPTRHYETEIITDRQSNIPVEVFEIGNIKLAPEEQITFFYLRDLRLRKKLEMYSIQMEKMLVLGELSAGIAHELRNPLFALANNLDYLNKQLKNQPAFKEIYPELQQSLNKIHKIVSSILDFASPHPPEFKRINLIEIIDKCLILVRKKFEKANIKIHQEFVGDCFEVFADPFQMEQVFVNLFMNSFKAMQDHGELLIKGRCKNGSAEISVEDSGLGIKEKDLARIFDPFYTQFESGTGLGLSIVQKILTQHQIKITVRSKPGYGSTFTLSFPKIKKKDIS